MTVEGNLVPRARANVGQSHQHESVSLEDVYGWIIADVVSDTDTEVTIAMNAAIWYGGYENFIPWEMGVYKVEEGASSIDGFSTGHYVQGHWEQTARMLDSNGEWAWYWVGEQTFTFQKGSSTYGLMPYFKICSINRWAALGDYGSGDYWIFGNTYGVLCMNSVTSSATHLKTMWHGIELDAWTILGGQTDPTTGNANPNTAIWTYDNCPLIVNDTTIPSNKRRVVAIAYYDASGTGHIVPLIS